ncbi:MAG: hypothetical protein QOJ15_384 [Bradyrhizobium sp.]|jgi:hypothetical protein|nr:hypothetical protein [Bradyrhizobium sp.]
MWILHRLASTPVQIAIAGTLYAAVCGYHIGRASPGEVAFDTRATAALLTSIATVTALVTTVSFALVVFTLNQVNSRKHDLYFRFKTNLFEFDKFLKDYSPKIPIINEAMALSWEAKFIKIDDFPLMGGWDDRLATWVSAMDAWDEEEAKLQDAEPALVGHEDPNLVNRILGFLGYLEDVANEIGIMCIRQIRAGHFIYLVTKALAILALLLVTLVICYEAAAVPRLAPAIAATPVFFVAFAVLMLFEIPYRLYREDRENLSFVMWDDERNVAEDSQSSAERLPWHPARD